MPAAPSRILAFAGSTRSASFNKRLVRIAAAGAEKAGTEVTLVDLRDYAMPLYDGDLEAEHGLPDGAARLKVQLLEHAGLLIATPEYNSSITGVLKNAIDWTSRSGEGGADLSGWRGKVAALVSASPGGFGASRALVHVRAILQNIGCLVLPAQASVSRAGEAFDDTGGLVDPKQRQRVEGVGAALAAMLAKLG